MGRVVAVPFPDECLEPDLGNLMKLEIPEWRAREGVYSRKGYWRTAYHPSVQWEISNKRFALVGYYSILDQYESLRIYN